MEAHGSREGGPPPATASDLYADYLGRVLGGEPVDFEELVAAHEDLRDELVELHRQSEWIRECLDGLQDPDDPDRDPSMVGTGLQTGPGAGIAPAGGRYQALGEIGHGGMGAVYAVWDRSLRRRIALKSLLDPDARRDSRRRGLTSIDRMTRFISEAQITGQLEHPGIVPVYELGTGQDRRTYFTMRLIKGESLDRVLAKVNDPHEPGWTLPRVVGILLKACEAVAYAHSRGVVHRDLKPSNIMIGRFGEVYVMDWGLAKVIGRQEILDLRIRPVEAESNTVLTEREVRSEDLDSPLMTMEGTVVGTPVFMSPEQAAGEEVGAPSDVYSLGCILYQALTGQRPYVPAGKTLSPRVVLATLLHGPPVAVRSLAPRAPMELVSICEKAMARAPQHRYPDTMQLAEDLRAFLEGRVVRAHRTGAAVELAKWVRRNRSVAALAILAIALTCLFGVSSYFKGQEVARALETTLLHADLTQSSHLLQEVDSLWPCRESNLSRMDHWLSEARTLLDRGQLHAQYRAQILPSQRDEALRWDGHRQRLDRLRERVAEVEGRRQRAAGIHAATVEDHADEWEEVQMSVLDGATYQGIELEPQVGLVPLGRDETTLFWEFWHVESGARPAPDGEGGYVIGPESGMVFILLPGGDFTMGGQSRDPDAPNYETVKGKHVRAVKSVHVEPFLLSKYEMTTAQWVRLAGFNPSRWTPTQIPLPYALEVCAVDRPSWDDCARVLSRFQLGLPSEAQWEYAARAGTTTTFWFGDDEQELQRCENIGDVYYAGLFGGDNEVDWKDGFGFISPVGSMDRNPFGFHDMLGNLAEWCQDTFDSTEPDDVVQAVVKGGCYSDPPSSSHCSFRAPFPRHLGEEFIGVRPIWQWQR